MRLTALPIILAGGALLSPSCAPSATEGGFDSANPAAKMYAIEQAAKRGDKAELGRIVEQLDSDDPAVRLLAITTLKRLTGETFEYRHHDPKDVRDRAMRRWTEYASGQSPEDQPKPVDHGADHDG